MKEKIKNNEKIKILTPTGYKDFSGMRRVKKPLYKVVLEDNNFIEVTKDHPFSIIKNNKDITACLSELFEGDRLQTKTGYKTITSITLTNKFEWAYDLLDVKDAVYYINDIVSHNCFLETGQSAVDGEQIDKWRITCKPAPISLMDGNYNVWEEPNPDRLYVIGCDVAEGVGQAASVAQILDVTDLTNINQVGVYHNNVVDPFHFAGVMNEIAHHWGKPHLLIERNNCGGTVIDNLKEVHHYHNIVDYSPEKQQYYDKLGIYSHTNAKYRGVLNMRYWMNGLKVVRLNDIATVQELETFVKYPNGTWKKKPGDYIFDDRVMAICWALFALEPEIAQQYFEIVSYDKNGKPLKIKPLEFVEPEYFKLDPFFQNVPDAPLPAFIGTNPDIPEDSIEGLQQKGWRIPENYDYDRVFDKYF